MDGILIGTTNPCQSRAGSNGNEEVLHTPQISRTGASQLSAVLSYIGYSKEELNSLQERQAAYSKPCR